MLRGHGDITIALIVSSFNLHNSWECRFFGTIGSRQAFQNDDMAICVFGSLNMDLAIRAPRLPQPGETLSGHGFLTLPGGKGANQAVAAARLGSSVNYGGACGGG
jgi:pfkB family carbohydrate kinase